MRSASGEKPATLAPFVLDQPVQAALFLLLEAYECAQSVEQDPWEFAVELRSLVSVGISHSALRWLACRGYVAHAIEQRAGKGLRRTFCQCRSLSLTEQSCFVLKDLGVVAAREGNHGAGGFLSHSGLAGANNERALHVPLWDREQRTLWWHGAVVKRFRQPAGNQVTLVTAFQEEGWPQRIDNPLGGRGNCTGKERLHDTIKRLNQQKPERLLVFHADGTGEGVYWEPYLLKRSDSALTAPHKSPLEASPFQTKLYTTCLPRSKRWATHPSADCQGGIFNDQVQKPEGLCGAGTADRPYRS
jgi:hypothetical protein